MLIKAIIRQQLKKQSFNFETHLKTCPAHTHADWSAAWDVFARYNAHENGGATYAMQGYTIDSTGTVRPDVLADHLFIKHYYPIALREVQREHGTP